MGARAMHASELGHAWDARTKGSESLRLNNGLCTAPHILTQQLCIYIYSFAHIRAQWAAGAEEVKRAGRRNARQHEVSFFGFLHFFANDRLASATPASAAMMRRRSSARAMGGAAV